MLPEPTRSQRQHEAFALLRASATRAHRDGDGLLASSLSETALQEISRLIAQGTLQLPLRELQWAIIFQMYWLLHKHSITTTFELLQKWPCSTDDDKHVKELLLTYIRLLSEPFLGTEATLRLTEPVALPAFGANPFPETIELARHFIELIWLHTVAEGQWKQILAKWIAQGPPWIKSALADFDQRLQIQAQLTCPSFRNAPLPENAALTLAEKIPLAGLWLMNLYGNRDEVAKMVTSQLARYNIEDYQWRLIADFGHTNLVGEGAAKSQAAWIARRRSMTLRFPILIFHDRRELRISELLLELLRTAKPDQGHTRQEIYLLAMLHELAALRIWDYWMWAEATRAQSLDSLESAQWDKNAQDMLAVNGLSLGVRGRFLEAQSALVEKGIAKLEFAPATYLRSLSEIILTTYPLQQHPTESLLVKISDLFPEDLWPALADWTLSYAKRFRERRFLGFKINVLEHWLDVIPSLAETSTVWNILQPEALTLGRLSHTWRGGDTETVLLYWLLFAPLDLARSLASTIASVPTADLAEKMARVSLFIRAEKGRPAFERQLTRQLDAEPQDTLVSTLLHGHLGTLSPEEINNLRQDIERRTEAFLAQAVPAAGSQQIQLGGWVPNFGEFRNWTAEDIPFLEKLISAVNSPSVLNHYIPALLNMVQLMAAFGAPEISRRLVPELTRWIQTPPSGRSFMQGASSAFSLVQINDATSNMEQDLGWLVFQMVRKLDVEGQILALAWTKKTLMSPTSGHLPVAFHQNLVIATKSDAALAGEALQNLEAILFRLCIHVSDGKSEAIVGVLRYMANALQTHASELLDWSSETGSAALRFLVKWCEENIPRLGRNSDPDLREVIGSLLSALQGRDALTDLLREVLTNLSRDNRARVRFSARGGWNSISF